ncbi:hypothetical protein [Streptomyces mexicanus]|uniref:Uncharacterized protein n=1 Tax=Streptomyces mexicanus TaxID=178566 RepID=A0A7X1LUI8_9ACTN|nr:hypothetical protein [Streptomyces mexicanus]MBC2869827.1 hypothetical protein [Streptomyces mexicanus]
MRKRSGRPPKFAAVPNETIDNAVALDFMALALLTVLLRHQDGWEITLKEIGEKYGYGRDAMAGAMGLLQVAQYVVKVRYQLVENNQWATEVVVYEVPATDEEIQDLLETIDAEPQVRPGTAEVIQPTKKAFEAAAKRREKLLPRQRGQKGINFTVPSRGAAAAGGRGSQGKAAEAKPPAQQPRKTAAAKSTRAAAGAKAPGKRLSREQAAAMRLVEEAFPTELQLLLPSYRPAVLRDAILEALDSRTADVVAERIKRRWWKHGYEEAAAPGGKGIGSPVGVAVALVRPSTDCPEPMCEDGVILDTSLPCRTCKQRREDHKADRVTGVPEQRGETSPGAAPTRTRWKCRGCTTLGRGEAPEDRLCRQCRRETEEAEAAARALQERLLQAEEERKRIAAEQWDAMLEEAYAEHAEREQAAAEERARQEEQARRRAEEEAERRRLQEEIARQHPELLAYSQTG